MAIRFIGDTSIFIAVIIIIHNMVHSCFWRPLIISISKVKMTMMLYSKSSPHCIVLVDNSDSIVAKPKVTHGNENEKKKLKIQSTEVIEIPWHQKFSFNGENCEARKFFNCETRASMLFDLYFIFKVMTA
jgi:hypothetical protein